MQNKESEKMVPLSKVKRALAFFPEVDVDEYIAIIEAVPRKGITPEEVAAVELFQKPDNGNLNQLCDALDLEGDTRIPEALKVVQRVEKYQKNRETLNAYDEEPAAPAAPAAAAAEVQ